MLKSYKYAIQPTKEQEEQLSMFFGSCRLIYNLGLQIKIKSWNTASVNISAIDLQKQLSELKKEEEGAWLKKCPSQSLQSVLWNLETAYINFYNGSGFPKFKSKRSKQSIQLPQGVRADFDTNTIFIPKLKQVKCIFHRQFKGEIKTVTVSKTTTDKYFVSILVDNQEQLPMKKPICTSTTVGIDMGIKTFATLSDGSSFENPKFLRSNLKRLRVEQRKLSRRFKRGVKEQSKSYQRQKLVVAKLHEHIANQRKDYLQKVSTHIIKEYDTICLEDLNINGMIQNRSLALAIGEIGWYSFKKMLEYKAEWYGKNILCIGRFEPSSKQCSNCQTLYKELTLGERNWTCQSCGIKHERDINAAINIKTIGLRNKPSIVNVSH